LPQLEKLHRANEAWDLVADIRATSLEEFDKELREVHTTEGVLNSETSILLSTV
jgi:DNA-binding Lrp family transcriptional regulator